MKHNKDLHPSDLAHTIFYLILIIFFVLYFTNDLRHPWISCGIYLILVIPEITSLIQYRNERKNNKGVLSIEEQKEYRSNRRKAYVTIAYILFVFLNLAFALAEQQNPKTELGFTICLAYFLCSDFIRIKKSHL